MVRVVLLTAANCPYCPVARSIWEELRKEYDFEFEEVDVNSEKGKILVVRHGIMAVPTTLIDDKVAFIGIPRKEKAIEAIKS